MVPLWLATVIGVAAFLIPVAFLAGFLVASEWIGARARALPDVAAGPPSARESAPHATAPSTAAPARTPATEALSGDAARAAHDGLALAALPTPAPAQERSPGPPLDASPATALESNPAEDTGAGPAPTLLRVGPPPR